MVKIGIALMQSGICLMYFIFVPHNLHVSILELMGWDISKTTLLWVMVGLQIPLSWIKDIRKLTCTNASANGLILYGLLVCLWFALIQAASTTTTTTSSIADMTSNQTDTVQQQQNTTTHTSTATTTFEPSDEPILSNLWNHWIDLHPFGKYWIMFIGTSVLLFEGL